MGEVSTCRRCFCFPNANELLLMLLQKCGPLGLFVIFRLLREAQGKGTLLFCQKQSFEEHGKKHPGIQTWQRYGWDGLVSVYHSRVHCYSSQLTVATRNGDTASPELLNFDETRNPDFY